MIILVVLCLLLEVSSKTIDDQILLEQAEAIYKDIGGYEERDEFHKFVAEKFREFAKLYAQYNKDEVGWFDMTHEESVDKVMRLPELYEKLIPKAVAEGLYARKPDENSIAEIESHYKPDYVKKAKIAYFALRDRSTDLDLNGDAINQRYKNFLKNYQRFLKTKNIEGKGFDVQLNNLALLDDREIEEIFQLEQELPGKDQDQDRKMINEHAGVPYDPPADRAKDARKTKQTTLFGELLNYDQRATNKMEDCQNRVKSLLDCKNVDKSDDVTRAKCDLMLKDTSEEGQAKMWNEVDIGCVKEPCYDNETLIVPLRRCLNSKNTNAENFHLNNKNSTDYTGVPDEFNDWETLQYTKFVLTGRDNEVMAAGWAIAAVQTMDMYQQIYAPKTSWEDRKLFWEWRNLTDFQHILKCVYRDRMLSRGSPQAAYEYMSKKVVIPQQNYWPPNGYLRDEDGNTGWDRDPDTFLFPEIVNYVQGQYGQGFTWISYNKLWSDTLKPDKCDVTDLNNQANKNVMFMPGIAYMQFADDEEVMVWNEDYLEVEVKGEKLAKPLLYKKGPVNAMMTNICYEIFFVSDGLFDYDCKKSENKYLPQWVTIVSYGPIWFGVLMPQYRNNKHMIESKVTKVSRRVIDNAFDWKNFVVPRVTPYTNVANCTEGGISVYEVAVTKDQTDTDKEKGGMGLRSRCFCPIGKWGKTCNMDCPITCLNGGTLSHYGCKCDCPNTHWGRQCGKVCSCSEDGRCDKVGNCICHRQSVWGKNCGNTCECLNGGYCHNDGTCECLNGFSGPTCTEKCTKPCVFPKVCRFSGQLGHDQNRNSTMPEYCDCPFGTFGKECDKMSDCKTSDIDTGIARDLGPRRLCERFQRTNRCFEDEAYVRCPNSCGHCFYLNLGTAVDN